MNNRTNCHTKYLLHHLFELKLQNMRVAILLLIFIHHVLVESSIEPHPCDDDIYCFGDLLKTIELARIYNDSKTFVDQPIKDTRESVHENFKKLMEATGGKPAHEDVVKFVDENFLPEGSEFEDWDPSDWTDDIPLFDKIKDSSYKDFAKDLHSRWQELGRVISSKVETNPEKYSLIYLKRPFVVPGGRFREMYYWDSYWTIKGLLVSQMKETVKGMLENFANLVQAYGLIPNGNRIYYTRRSQPPLFIPMFEEYFKATGDKEFLKSYLPVMEREFMFWKVNRTTPVTVDDQEHILAHYDVEVDEPRPESYYEDYHHAQVFEDSDEKTEFYRNMKSGAESGWDYSTKWFMTKDGGESMNLTDVQTRHVIPVELNAYLCKNAETLSRFYELTGETDKAKEFDKIRDDFQTAIEKVLWNNERGAWFDFDLLRKRQRDYFYPTNVLPLWAECYSETKLREKSKRVIEYMSNHQAFKYPGGVPSSMVRSGQQWDFSNAWAPLQELIVTGLEKTQDPKGLELALSLVKKWIKNNYVAYLQSEGKMFEKYDAEHIGLSGGGGEYEVVLGFGWTNAVVLHFLDKYGDVLEYDGTAGNRGTLVESGSGVVTSLLAVLAMLFGRQ